MFSVNNAFTFSKIKKINNTVKCFCNIILFFYHVKNKIEILFTTLCQQFFFIFINTCDFKFILLYTSINFFIYIYIYSFSMSRNMLTMFTHSFFYTALRIYPTLGEVNQIAALKFCILHLLL